MCLPQSRLPCGGDQVRVPCPRPVTRRRFRREILCAHRAFRFLRTKVVLNRQIKDLTFPCPIIGHVEVTAILKVAELPCVEDIRQAHRHEELLGDDVVLVGHI